jgi:serine protease Do
MPWYSFQRLALVVLCLAASSSWTSAAQLPRRTSFSAERVKSGSTVLRAFSALMDEAKGSVVRFDIDGEPAALGAVIDADGLVITKASEMRPGKLTCRLPNGGQAVAQVLVSEDDNDVALVKVAASALKPVDWAIPRVMVGQWAVTPGIENVPEAVGIVSTPPRKILSKQAYLGITPDFDAAQAKIARIMPGLGADQAGLKAGDVILKLNNLPIRDSQDLVTHLRQFRDGQKVKLRVQREEEEWETEVTMMANPPDRRWRRFNRQERMNRLGGDLSKRAEGFQSAIQHDSVLQPWQCGGPLLDLDGKAIGLNIARAGRVASYALPASLVRQIIDELKNELKAPLQHETSSEAVH